MSLYSVLRVKQDATNEELKKAYRYLARDLHPDKNKEEGAKEKFQEVEEAYRILKDPEKRKRYDETGDTGKAPDINAEAMRIITTLFLQVCENANFKADNYFKKVKELIHANLRQITSDAIKFDKQIKALGYLISKTTANDIFLSVLNGKLEDIKGRNQHAEEAKKVLSKALEILADFEYTGKLPPEYDTTIPPFINPGSSTNWFDR